MSAVKNGESEVILRMLKSNPYYVYDYDHIQQTALHWAGKRNYKEIIEILVDYGANVNCFDIVTIPTINNYSYIGWPHSFIFGSKGKQSQSCEGLIGSWSNPII
jgi:hypothetical protein